MPVLKLSSIPPWEPKRGQQFLKDTATTNPSGYAKGFMMQSYEVGDLWFPSFRKCFSIGANLAEWKQRGLPTFVGVDLAGDKRPGNALVVLGLDPTTQHRYVLDVRNWSGSVMETIRHITDAVTQCGNLQYVMIENNGVQQMLIDWITQGSQRPWWWHKVEPFTTGKNKADERYGLRTLEVEFHHQAWVVPANEFSSHAPTCLCSWCTWAREFSLYPKGASTDLCMASWFARDAISRWGGAIGVDLAGSLKGLKLR